MRYRSFAAFLLSVAGAVGCGPHLPTSPPPDVIETAARTGMVPWSEATRLGDESDFSFVVVADRTVGHRDGVFEEEMPRRLVFVTRQGPVIANLRLDGILPSDVVTAEPPASRLSFAKAIRREPVAGVEIGQSSASAPRDRVATAHPGAGPEDPFRPLIRELLKALFCAVLAVGSWGVFAAAAGRRWETTALRRSVVFVTLAKPALCFALYLSRPSSSFGSDAAIYYLPETLRWLSGEIPYRDFRTSYAPLFHLLLMPAVIAWPAPGSVVATILAMEIALIVLYARRFARSRPTHTWRVLFLYCFSPISFYWVALTGYNSVLIALFTLIALLLAEAKRDWAAGFAALLGLAFSKLTMILAWPAIVFFPRGSVVRRIAPLLGLLVFLPALIFAGIDIFQRALDVGYRSTSGNVWFLVSLLVSASTESRAIKFASMLSLFASLSIMGVFYLRRSRSREADAFDQASAFYSACALVFMLLAYKTYPWYLTMCLLFLLHTLVGSGRSSAAALLPFALLGSLTTFEPGLSIGLRSWLGPHWLEILVPIDLVVIACLAYYAWHGFRIAVGRGVPRPLGQ